MSERMQLLVFLLDRQRYALPLATVGRVVRAVQVTPLPGAPAIVFGAINVQGEVVPVLDVRRRFQLPERGIAVSNQFLIARAGPRTVALVVDEAQEVVESAFSSFIGSDRIVPGLEQFQGVVKLDDGLVLIHDLERFLSLDEARALDEALAGTA